MRTTRVGVFLAIAALVWMTSLLAGCPADSDSGKQAVSKKAPGGTLSEDLNRAGDTAEEVVPPMDEIPADEPASQLFMVPELAASGKAKEIYTALTALDGVIDANVIENEGALVVEYIPTEVAVEDLKAVIEGFGVAATAPGAACCAEDEAAAEPTPAQGECDGECDSECSGDCDEAAADDGCAADGEECGSCAAPEGVMPEAVPEGLTRVKLSVEGMDCNGKAGFVVKLLGGQAGVKGVYPDAAAQTLVADFAAGETSVDAMVAAINGNEAFKASVIE